MASSKRKKLNALTPPERFVKRVGEEYPNAWGIIDEHWRRPVINDWPLWCYAPVGLGVSIVRQRHDIDSNPLLMMADDFLTPADVIAAGIWRKTKGVYRFDPTLANELMSQPLDCEIPIDVLYRLPEWCCYIELPSTKGLCGFFSHLEYDINTGDKELRIVTLYHDGTSRAQPILLRRTLRESMLALVASTKKHPYTANHDYNESQMMLYYQNRMAPLINLVLYLCARNSDLPQATISVMDRRREERIPTANQARVWDVGERVGAAIRRAQHSTAHEHNDGAGDRQSPRPHLRRAHWHHYRVGAGRQKLVLKWVAPVFVGDHERGMPVVLHEVDNQP